MTIYSYDEMKLLLEIKYWVNMYEMTSEEITDRLPDYLNKNPPPVRKQHTENPDMKHKEADKPVRNMFELSIQPKNKKILKSMFRKYLNIFTPTNI